MLPTVQIQKADGQTGVTRPSDVGILAIIAPSELGTANRAEMFLREDLALEAFGGGPLVQCAAYVLPVSGAPVVLVKGDGSTAGAYSAVAHSGAGTSVATADGATVPLDDYKARIRFIEGGTIGVAGITYKYSLDDGASESALKALGTAVFITIPDAGVRINFAAGTILADQTESVTTTAPVDTNADLTDALEALRVTSTPFEAVLVHSIADAAAVAIVDAWIRALALTGRFKIAICTARPRDIDNDETEAEYKDALELIYEASVSTDIVLCADLGDLVNAIPGRATSGITQGRPVSWAVAARLMRIPIGRDAAYVNDQPVPEFGIRDARNNPKYHDEYKHPGLDDLRITTLRTFDGKQGSFITNANLISSTGSDYVYAQHARCINRACELSYAVLTGQLSRGVKKNPKPGPNGERYIDEADALRIEGVVNGAIQGELAGEVDEIRFVLSRSDDISSNQGAVVTASLQAVALAYIKKFTVSAGYVKSIAAQ